MKFRNDRGQFSSKHTDAEVVAAVRAHAPAATSEVATELGITRQGADYRLRRLRESGHLTSKKIGASLVWFVPTASSTDERTPDSPHERAFEDFASRAMETHGGHIEEIVLFGSTARGETRGIDSDVDVFVVVDTMKIKDALGEIAYDVMHTHGVVVAEVVKPKELVENNPDHPLVKTVRREGRAYV